MEPLRGGVFARQKDPLVLGTHESSAFILSLRDPNEFSTTHSFGYHCIPHIGVYGNDYSLSLPMVLLSLPALPSCLQKLPSDLVNALDLADLVTQTNTQPKVDPPSPSAELQLFSQHIHTVLQDQGNLNPELCNRVVARELVKFVLSSACSKLGLNGNNYFSSGSHTTSFRELRESRKRESAVSMETIPIFFDYRRTKRNSSVTMSIASGEASRRESVMSQQYDSGCPARTSGMVAPPPSPCASGSPRISIDDRSDEEQLHITAKKLVKKILHLACKRWESQYRRSSIEDLINRTKRMRIDSPSPPPALPEEAAAVPPYIRVESPELQSLSEDHEEDPMPTSGRRVGKKRNRSESHDINMLKELEKFRQTRLQEMAENSSFNSRRGSKPDSTALHLPSSYPRETEASGSSLHPHTGGLSSLISGIGRMSIAEVQPDEDESEDCESDGEYTVLNPITKQLSPEPYSQDSDSERTAGIGAMLTQSVEFPPAVSPTPEYDSYQPESPTEERFSVSYPGAKNGPATNRRFRAIVFSTDFQVGVLPEEHPVIPEMDLFLIIHTHPVPGLCQKFLCNNRDEINLLYHCWLFRDFPFDQAVSGSEQLEMGIFEPFGVQPVHLDLQDAGVAFYYLDPRTVCIHNCQFSPENAQLQLLGGGRFHSFYSAARYGERRVVAFHIVPATEHVEQQVRRCVSKCSTLQELLKELGDSFPEVGLRFVDLLSPFQDQ